MGRLVPSICFHDGMTVLHCHVCSYEVVCGQSPLLSFFRFHSVRCHSLMVKQRVYNRFINPVTLLRYDRFYRFCNCYRGFRDFGFFFEAGFFGAFVFVLPGSFRCLPPFSLSNNPSPPPNPGANDFYIRRRDGTRHTVDAKELEQVDP